MLVERPKFVPVLNSIEEFLYLSNDEKDWDKLELMQFPSVLTNSESFVIYVDDKKRGFSFYVGFGAKNFNKYDSLILIDTENNVFNLGMIKDEYVSLLDATIMERIERYRKGERGLEHAMDHCFFLDEALETVYNKVYKIYGLEFHTDFRENGCLYDPNTKGIYQFKIDSSRGSGTFCFELLTRLEDYILGKIRKANGIE